MDDLYKSATLDGCVNNAMRVEEFLIHQGNLLKSVDFSKEKSKFVLIEMTKNRPDLHDRILNIEKYYELIQILKDYDTEPEIVKKRIAKAHSKINLTHKERAVELEELKSNPNTKFEKVSNPNKMKVGDYIKYVGPRPIKFGYIKKNFSVQYIKMEYDLENEPKEMSVRVSEVELIIE